MLATFSGIYSQISHNSEFITVSGKKMAYKSFGLNNRKAGEPV